jgi:hypothetical protein
MVDNAIGAASEDRHVKRIEDEFSAQVISHCPADDATAEDVQDDGKIQKSGPRRNVGDVGDPDLIWSIGAEVPLDEIRCRPSIAVTDGRYRTFSRRNAVNTALSHQPCDALSRYSNAFILEIGM